MENLESVLENVTVEPIEEVQEVVTTTLEPTTEEIFAIIEAIKEGKDNNEIKKEVRRFVYEKRTRDVVIQNEDGSETTTTEEYDHQVSAQGFTFEQIQEIRDAYLAKLQPNQAE